MLEDDRNLNFEGSSTEAGPRVEMFLEMRELLL